MVTNIFTNGTVADATKVNQNFTDIESTTSAGIAQNAYQTIQANNVFENKDYLAVDEYTVAAGTNSTVNTGSSTASFLTNRYEVTSTKTLFQNPTLAVNNNNSILNYNITINKLGIITKVVIQNSGANVGVQNVTVFIKDSLGNTLASITKNSINWYGSLTYTYNFTDSDYSRNLKAGETISISTNIDAVRSLSGYSQSNANYTITNQNMNAFSTNTIIPIEFEALSFNTSGKTVVCDTGTLTLDGTEKSIQVYGDNTTPANTSINVDIASATLGKSFTWTNSTSIQGFFMKSDGLQMYVIDNANAIDEYALSTAFDVTTATFTATKSGLYNIYAPVGMFFKSDGLKLFIAMSSSNIVYEYTLTTAWNISTLGAAITNSYNTSAQTTTVYEVFINPTGTKMFVTSSSNIVYEYTLTTAWNISTATYAGKNINTSSIVGGIYMRLNDAGTVMYLSRGADLYEYNLSTTFDITTATYSGNTFNTSSEGLINISGFSFKSDGLKLYVSGNIKAFEYTLTTAYDLSTISYNIVNSQILTNTLTNNATGVIDISSLNAGTLKLTYNLATTDTAVTPSTKGWGVFIFK